VLAISSLTWALAAGFALVSAAVLIRVVIGLIRRVKDLMRTLSRTSEELNAALEAMREDLDRTSQGLAGLRPEGPGRDGSRHPEAVRKDPA
jgi:hypothetical protein